MGRRVLIDELMKTTFRYYFFFCLIHGEDFPHFWAKAKTTFHGTRYRNICLPGRTKSDNPNLFLIQISAFKN